MSSPGPSTARNTCKKDERMELKFKVPDDITWKKEAAACDKHNCKDESITIRNRYPKPPVPYFEVTEGFNMKKILEFMSERSVSIAKSIANDIIIPDPAPEWVFDILFDNYAKLEPILVKDSVRCFLQLFNTCAGRGMSWNLTVTSLTLTLMVSFDALRCAKVVLEGKTPELHGMHANPNCITKYGYFPIHEAAERFSLDMIKLLLRHGASANVRTVGNEVIEGLLPLHVAVENTCLHKYLEDNLSPSHNHLDYIYKLIHLLCLPEMKILDTTRLLAEKTNNLLEELWNYIEDGKLIQSAVLLQAAQDQIRGRYSSKINGSSKKDGFDIINKRILRLSFALRWEKGSGGVPHRLLDQRRALLDCTGLLVDVISHVGEPLSAYIQTHSEVSCAQVLEHVSSILKEYGFCPTREVMDTKNLQPYDCKPSDRESHNKEIIDGNSTVMETANLYAASAKVARKKLGRGWDPTCTRRCFFPYWRSVLRTRCPVKVYPTYARADTKTGLDLKQFRVSSYNSTANASTPTPNHKHSPVGRISPLASKQLKRSLLSKKKKKTLKRSFSTAATGAFWL